MTMTTTHRGLPVSHLTSFVGRDSEVARLCGLVSTHRLVVLTGEAGVGKSRTAARVAEVLRRSLGGSTLLVPLAGVVQGDVLSVLATALDAPEPSVAAMARALGDRPHLIVLDDLDHGPAVAAALAELLGSTLETRVLITSRRRTGLAGETSYVLAPMEVPTASAFPRGTEAVTQTPACALLLQRITDDDPAFDVGAAAAEDLFALCRAGDGVPRYIEAAARAVSALGLRETAIAVSEEPTVLDAFLRPGDGAERSESVLALALAVLSEPAAGLVRGLALLESGADLRFAADLFAEGRLSHIAAPAAELVAHSLVRSQTVAGHRRLQVPLHYRVQLQAQLSEEDRTRHQTALRRGLLDRLRRCAATWFSESQLEEVQFLNRHAADVAALLSAMSADPDDAREALEIISSLRYYWQLHPVDPWPRARDWLQSALALDHEGDAVTLRAVLTDAYIAFHEGDVHGARTRLEAVSHEQCAAAADAAERNFADFLQALVLLGEGEVDRAQSELRQVLQASLEQGTLDHLGEKYWYLAACHIAAGDQDEALEILEEGLAHCERLGEQLGRAYMLCLLALASDRRGSHDEAVRRVRESAQVMAQFGDRAGLALCLKLLSAFSARSGQDGTPAQSARLAAALTDGRALALPSVPIPEFARSSGTGPDVPAPHWEDSALREVLAGIIGAAQPSSPGGARAGAAGAQSVLSARESEIAALVAEGLGNPAIAARLVLSRRTVEGHVQRILAKLGFRSRSQIAVWAAQHAAADTTL